MLVKFISSETGELMMFAEVAHQLLAAVGKQGTVRGTFTVEEMLPAAKALKAAVERGEAPPSRDEEEESEKEKPVALGQRAWPFIDMLERTAQGGSRANIIWQATREF
ncbi:MAG: hypothetical protein H6R10_1704 [Rhodocyclaceae bacterium]|nr:hypothetical protein [Rhodocyclaceae bacterium]